MSTCDPQGSRLGEERAVMRRRFSSVLWLAIVLVVGLDYWTGYRYAGGQHETVKDASKHIYAGQPRRETYPHKVTVLKNKGFVLGYCEKRKSPVWVAYRLFKVENPKTEKRPSRFRVDERTKSKVNHDDYTRSGYDRGHMAPNYGIATRYGREAQLETFLMSNICPQKPKLNRQRWRLLEEKVAKEYANDLEEVWVITGPIFDEKVEQLASGVEIPDAFYKIVLDEKDGKPRMIAFVIQQEVKGNESLPDYLTSVDSVEKLTGLDFFSELENELENQLEAEKPNGLWQVQARDATIEKENAVSQADRVRFYACHIGDPLLIVTAGQTYLVNPSEKSVTIGDLKFTGRDTNGDFIFTEPLKFKKPCPPWSTGSLENGLVTLEGVANLWVRYAGKTEKMEKHTVPSEKFEKTLKSGKL